MEEDPFPGWGLRAVELADQATLAPYLASLAEPLSDYTFSQIYSWQNSLRILWTTLRGHLCVFANGTGDLTLLMPPIGSGDSTAALKAAFELMDDYNAAHGVPGRSRVEYVSQELLDRFDRTGLFVRPMGADYVYDVNRMIDLAGGDLASKRQARNRFIRNYKFRVEPYDPAKHLEPARALLEQWRLRQDAEHLEEPNINAIKRQKESIATALTLQTAGLLNLTGMVVLIDEPEGPALRGLTFGETIGTDQSSIVIEKTDLSVKGLAQFIFSEFCRTCWSHRPLVNVGDDWGLESLAWTKMSYRPVKMLQKYEIARVPAVRMAMGTPMTMPNDATNTTPKIATAGDGATEATVREAARPDLAAIADLERACFNGKFSLSRRQLHYLCHRPSVVFRVAESEGVVVGEAIALVRQHQRGLTGRIYSLAVREDCRRHRIGGRLLRAVLDGMAARGVRRVFLEVESTNRAAIALYTDAGFRTIGALPGYFGPGRDGSHMLFEVQTGVTLFDPVAVG